MRQVDGYNPPTGDARVLRESTPCNLGAVCLLSSDCRTAGVLPPGHVRSDVRGAALDTQNYITGKRAAALRSKEQGRDWGAAGSLCVLLQVLLSRAATRHRHLQAHGRVPAAARNEGGRAPCTGSERTMTHPHIQGNVPRRMTAVHPPAGASVRTLARSRRLHRLPVSGSGWCSARRARRAPPALS